MKAHLSLFFVRQRKNFLALPLSPQACLPAVRGKSGGEGKREVCNEERRSGHWCGPE